MRAMCLTTGRTVTHFDGGTWSNLPMPNEETVDGAAAAGSDLVVATGASHDDSAVHRRRGGVWTKEITPAGISVLTLFGGGTSMWGVGEDADSRQTLLRRTPAGGTTWTEEAHDDAVISLWGRSSTDVYGVEGDTLIHFDGKAWSNLDDDVAGAQSVTGTPTEVLVLRAAAAP